MGKTRPELVVIAGPNGAGKTTAAPELLRDWLGTLEFVNADTIATGLSGFNAAGSSIAAGRLMLARLHALAAGRASFSFETTLASRGFAPWIEHLCASGYRFHLFFLWLPCVEMAIERVRTRVERGGHDIAEVTLRRRYARGRDNFFALYRQLAHTWQVLDNSGPRPMLVASGRRLRKDTLHDEQAWQAFAAGRPRC